MSANAILRFLLGDTENGLWQEELPAGEEARRCRQETLQEGSLLTTAARV